MLTHKRWPSLGLSIASVVVMAALSAGCGNGSGGGGAETGEPLALTWDMLVPKDYDFDDPLAGIDVSGYADDDPRAQELLAKLRDAWVDTPVVDELHGERVRLGGFVVPLEGDGSRVTEFLLVPYYGACIHVPPPPPNQVVHVHVNGDGISARLFDAVWLTGTMRAQRSSSELADAGYSMRPDRIEPF